MDTHLIDVSTPSTASGAVIGLDGIGRRNPRGNGWLIEGVSLSVHAGDRLGVLGPSGAGKTVLLRAMAMLDPLDLGAILWHGRTVQSDGVPHFRKQVMYLHQRPALFEGSVEDNLRVPFALAAHRDRVFDRTGAVDLLANLGRDADFLAKPSRRLSGGEGQLIALVRALQLEPSVLLLDEPTASLDPSSAQAVERAVENWLTAGGGGRAFVWVSHDLEQTRRMTTRQVLLRAGRLAPEE
jgi:putative ABC transport system ATP-binding protein